MSFTFAPSYDLVVGKVDPGTKRVSGGYRLQSLVSCQASLHTGQGVGQLSATLADYDGLILRDRASRPHPMDLIALILTNRHGQRAIAWTGVIDTVKANTHPGEDRTVTIGATSPHKYWEITRQLPGDVFGIAYSSMVGLKGSAILQWSGQPTECNFPGPLAQMPALLGQPGSVGFLIDPLADSGVQNWGGVASSIMTDPDQQTWSAVISAIQADAGLEWFFDEYGNCVWRRPGFLNVTKPRFVLPDDIFSLELAESDQNVVTRVEVRWGSMPQIGTAPFATAPAAMIAHLGLRNLVIHAPWLRTPGAAQALAQLLLEQYAANILTGTVIIPADPLYRLGSVIEVPNLRDGGSAYYYLASIGYQLAWGEDWSMSLGLSYGRTPQLQFPYDLGNIKLPALSSRDGVPQATTILTYDTDNPRQVTTLFVVKQDTTLAGNTASVDPALIPPGSLFLLKDTNGFVIGEFTAVAGKPGSVPTIYVANTLGKTQGQALIINTGQYTDPTTTSSAGGGTNSQPTAKSTDQTPGAATSTPGGFTSLPIQHYTITQPFGDTTYTTEPPYTDPSGNPHAHFHTGVDLAAANLSPVFAVCDAIVVGMVAGVGATPTTAYFCSNSGQGACVKGVNFNGFGNTVVLQAGDLLIHYSHLDHFDGSISVGSAVKSGAILGYEGSTYNPPGYSSGPHLHLGVFRISYGGWVNPADFFYAGNIPL